MCRLLCSFHVALYAISCCKQQMAAGQILFRPRYDALEISWSSLPPPHSSVTISLLSLLYCLYFTTQYQEHQHAEAQLVWNGSCIMWSCHTELGKAHTGDSLGDWGDERGLHGTVVQKLDLLRYGPWRPSIWSNSLLPGILHSAWTSPCRGPIGDLGMGGVALKLASLGRGSVHRLMSNSQEPESLADPIRSPLSSRLGMNCRYRCGVGAKKLTTACGQ